MVTKKKDKDRVPEMEILGEDDISQYGKIDPAKLIPYEKNARVHGSEIEFLKNSIKELNFRDPIEVDKDWVIVSGHGRLKAALENGLESVRILRWKDMTADEAKLYRLNANKLNDLSTWDWDLVNDEVAELREKGFKMEDFSFEDFSDSFNETVEVETEPEDAIIEESVGEYSADEDYKILVTCHTDDDRKRAMDLLQEYGYDCTAL